MSEVKRKQIYIVIGSPPLGHDGAVGRAAVQLIVKELAVKGFKVSARDVDMIPEIPFTPVPTIFIEHTAAVSFQAFEAESIQPPREIRIRPPVPESLISYAHPLQISVIGEPNTGKTVLTNMIDQTLQLQDPTVFSLDHPHIQTWDSGQVNEMTSNLKDRIEINIRHFDVPAIGNLSKLF